MKSGKVTPDISANTVEEALPLGWTQIKRGKKRRKVDSTNDGDDNDCCDDPTCSNDTNAPTSTTKTCPKSNADADTSSEGTAGGKTLSQSMFVELEGKALFCLHSLDCSWFQGQFINARSTSSNSSSRTKSARGSSVSMKSIGLLAKQRDDLDECLQCSDGGYREIDLTLLASASEKGTDPNRNSTSNSNHKLQERKSIRMEKLSCTGGDMLQIKTPMDETSGVAKIRSITVSFDADQIITGKRVAPLVRRYFSSLVKISEGDVLDQLPDCAIVVGNMKMTLPQSFLKNKNKANPVPKKEDDDDDWLE